MKNLRKVAAITLCAALSITSVFANGAGEKTEVKQQGMTFSNWTGSEAGSKDVIEWMISSFNETQGPENKVTQINWPWGDTESQLALRAQSSEQFDVAQIDIKMLPALAQAGVLADLSEIFPSDYFTSNFTKGSMEVGQYKGVQYGVPWTVAPIAMISNTQILKDSGVDFEVKTIADFEKACKMVLTNHPANTDSDKGNDVVPFAAMTKDSGTAAPDYLVWLWTFGGDVFDGDGNCVIDSKDSIEALKWFKSLKDRGYIQDAMGRGDARILFKEGRVAFYNDALGAKGAIQNEKFGDIEDYVLPICNPTLTETSLPEANAWGHLLVVIKKTPKSADAMKFIEYLLSDDVALEYFEQTGSLPSKNSVLASKSVTEDYWSNSWTPILQNARLTELVGMNAAAYKSIITEELQSLLSGAKSPEDVAKTMKSRIDNI